jgi:CO/xanthine dehydrogenase Mo-binding subunit
MPCNCWQRPNAVRPSPPAGTDGRVGQSLSRYGAAKTVLGDRPFVDDLYLPGMLFGALVLSPHPRARVVPSTPAVRWPCPACASVATAADVPG